MNLDGIRLVTWDVDGTLYRRRALERALVLDCLKRTWREPRVWSDLQAARRYSAHAEAWRGRTLTEAWKTEHAEGAKLVEPWLARVLERVAPRPEAIRHLDDIRAARLTQVVLSDFASVEKLRALKLDGYFTAIYACSAIGALKPSPVPFQHVQQAHGVAPHEHLHIGDRPDTDEVGAKAAGARCLIL
jgi:HAD superfamily hydrolase (TIGR01549 family)